MPFGKQRQGFNNAPLPIGFQTKLTKQGFFIYSGAPALGNLVYSITAAAGVDPYGNAFRAEATDYSAGGQIVQIAAGTILFSAGGVTTDGFIQDLGGTAQWFSSQFGAGDTSAGLILQAKNQSNDGVHPELVVTQRMQLQDETGKPSWICQVDPNSPNADEVFHNFGFVNAWGGGGQTTPGYRLQADKAEVLLGGSFSVPAGVAAGQAMCAATPVQYQPNNVQSLTAWNLTGANANKQVRLFYTAAGILTFGGPLASVAGGDVLSMAFQSVALTR